MKISKKILMGFSKLQTHIDKEAVENEVEKINSDLLIMLHVVTIKLYI